MLHFLYPFCHWISKLGSRVLTHNIVHYPMSLLFPKGLCFFITILTWYLDGIKDLHWATHFP